MWILLALIALAVPVIILCLSSAGARLRQEAALPLAHVPDDKWPSVGLIIPAAGNHPAMPGAIRSVFAQSYPGRLQRVIVTATDAEPAADLARTLAGEFPDLIHVVAGKAEGSGQKNHNSIAAVRALGDSVDVLAFCDSTHLAQPDFLRRLMEPHARGTAEFTTGYHEVAPEDDRPVTLAYAMCVIVMRLMQGLSGLTQPWGGAMAIRRETFERAHIADFWDTNVVDDCSLTNYLKDQHVKVTLCPGALLGTRAANHDWNVWRAWLDRQVLFLKFCVPDQWVGLGLFALCAAAGPVSACVSLLMALFGKSLLAFFFCCVFLALSAVASASLRPFVARHVRLTRWLFAWFLNCIMFFMTFLGTVPAKGILWHGIWYNVGRRGRVEGLERKG